MSRRNVIAILFKRAELKELRKRANTTEFNGTVVTDFSMILPYCPLQKNN
jgi:hypothetical protein